jgi:hypothetical protein
MGRKSTERLGAKGKRCALDEPLFHHVHAHQLDAARAFRKRARDIFVVNHHVAENLPPQQLGMQIGLSEALGRAGTDLRVPLGEQLAAQLELSGIRGVGAEPGIKVFGVVGIKLALNDDFRDVYCGIGFLCNGWLIRTVQAVWRGTRRAVCACLLP